MGSVP